MYDYIHNEINCSWSDERTNCFTDWYIYMIKKIVIDRLEKRLPFPRVPLAFQFSWDFLRLLVGSSRVNRCRYIKNNDDDRVRRFRTVAENRSVCAARSNDACVTTLKIVVSENNFRINEPRLHGRATLVIITILVLVVPALVALAGGWR